MRDADGKSTRPRVTRADCVRDATAPPGVSASVSPAEFVDDLRLALRRSTWIDASPAYH
jgi:hypothetical protein